MTFLQMDKIENEEEQLCGRSTPISPDDNVPASIVEDLSTSHVRLDGIVIPSALIHDVLG
jgi:hypothetical protein